MPHLTVVPKRGMLRLIVPFVGHRPSLQRRVLLSTTSAPNIHAWAMTAQRDVSATLATTQPREGTPMADQPINPGVVDWSGENPGMYLKLDESGPFTCLVSFFRVVYSPHGGGHGVVILMDPQGRDPNAINAFYTDNRALAEYLKSDFVSQFGAFKGNPLLPNLPIREATSFTHTGDGRRSWTETIRGPGIDIALTWNELGTPFLVDYKPEHSATGKHYMASLFIPGQQAEVIVNGVRGVGKPIPRDMFGAKSTTAFLAFSETWVRG